MYIMDINGCIIYWIGFQFSKLVEFHSGLGFRLRLMGPFSMRLCAVLALIEMSIAELHMSMCTACTACVSR